MYRTSATMFTGTVIYQPGDVLLVAGKRHVVIRADGTALTVRPWRWYDTARTIPHRIVAWLMRVLTSPRSAPNDDA